MVMEGTFLGKQGSWVCSRTVCVDVETIGPAGAVSCCVATFSLAGFKTFRV